MKATFGGKEVTLTGTALKTGSPLPEFTLVSPGFSKFTASDIKLPALILTLPSVDTSVCSLELLTFNDRLEGTNYNVYGISCDLPFAQDRWIKTNAGDFITMLSDYMSHDFGKASGTLMEELKILARGAFVFDKEGICQYADILSESANEPDYDKVMEEAKKHFE